MAAVSGSRVHGATRYARNGLAVTSVAVLLAACGSSGSKSASSQPSTAAKSSGSASVKSGSGGSSGGSFCQKARQAEADQAANAQALTSNNPAQLQKFEEQSLAQLDGFVSSAPGQIKGAVATIAAADRKLFAQLKAVNFDVTKIGSSLGDITGPTFTNAAEQVTTYLAKVCGINPTAVPS